MTDIRTLEGVSRCEPGRGEDKGVMMVKEYPGKDEGCVFV